MLAKVQYPCILISIYTPSPYSLLHTIYKVLSRTDEEKNLSTLCQTGNNNATIEIMY